MRHCCRLREKLAGFLMNSVGNMQIRVISSDFACVPNYDTNYLFTEADCKEGGTCSAEILLTKGSLTESKDLIQRMFFLLFF